MYSTVFNRMMNTKKNKNFSNEISKLRRKIKVGKNKLLL